MTKIHRLSLTVLLSLLMFSTLSCTRSMGDKTVTVNFGSKIGGLSNSRLSTAFININIPGAAPISKRYQYDNNSGIVQGGYIEFAIDNVPSTAGILVQFLGVFEDDTGVMNFSYGDAQLVNSVANISTTSAGTVAAQGQIAGRLLASVPKTGRMTAYYTPSTNPNYPMAVEVTDIVQGWFNIFALDGGIANALTYKLDDGTVVFDKVYLSSGALTMNGSTVTTGNHLLKISYPTIFKQDYSNGQPTGAKGRAKTALYYGFFNGGTAPSTPHQVCYPAYSEGIIGLYKTSSMDNYINFIYTSGNATNDIVPTGGREESINNYYLQSGTYCNPATDTHLYFVPQMAQQDVEKSTMVYPPFKAVQPLSMGAEWLTTKTVPNGGSTDYTFTWNYLPGITSAEVDGADILQLPSSNGGGDTICETLLAQGASIAGNVTGITATKTLTASGSSNFAVCAYKTTSAGSKRYFKNYLRSGCHGQCNPFHFGWSAGSGTVSLSGIETFNGGGVMASQYTKATGIASSPASYPNYTQLTVGSNTGFSAGDEVMLAISGAGALGQCGSSQYDAGYTGFARVLGVDSSNIVRISRGSFVEELSSNNLSGTASSGTFCALQMLRVPHFTNLTISGSGQVSAASYSHSSGGGIVAFRVNGQFTHGGIISAVGAGYEGGSVYYSSYPNGAGPRKDTHSGGTVTMGGIGTASGGGGGAGAEYNSVGATLGGAGGQNSISNNYFTTLFGGGGGGGSNTAATGGGSIFITARKLIANNGVIKAYGATASGDAGGGGGGSITISTKFATGSGFLVEANGGGAANGGVGGGGYARAYFCNNNGISEGGELLLTAADIKTGVGTGSYGTGATANTTFSTLFPSVGSGNNYYYCNQ